MKRLITLILFFVSFSVLAFAEDFNKSKLDSLLDLLSQNDKVMGSLAISKNGQVIYSKAIGFAYNGELKKTYSTPLTKYRIGSISKMFTSVMILQLVEENKLALDNTLDKFYPQIPNSKKITIKNLLNHRSGIHNFTNDKEYGEYQSEAKTHEEMIDIIVKGGSDFEPDSKAEYSNSNYVLLGYIIEKVTGNLYSQQLKERITDKIGLTNTYYGGKTKIKNNEALSYKFAGVWKTESITDMSIPHGAGAIVSTPSDLNSFIWSLFNGKLLKSESLTKMTEITEGYGLGVFQMPFNEKKAYGHTGGIDGFQSNLAYFPEDKISVAFCANGVNYNVNDLMIGTLSIIFGKDYKLPIFSNFKPNPADMINYEGVYKCDQLPISITVKNETGVLTAQATGQQAFTLEAVEKDVFKFDQAGVEMIFNIAAKEFTLKQGGQSFIFKK